MSHQAFARVHRWIDQFGQLPAVWHLRRAMFARRFRGRMAHAFQGSYSSFEAAAAAVPKQLPSSYDNEEAARMYVERTSIDDHDYPALFWLLDAIAMGLRSIADIGGSTGIKFYAFERFVRFPADLRWHVVEVPAAARLGREIAHQRQEKRLEFSSDYRDATGCDVLFASGSLQYLPQSLGEMLAGYQVRPQRVLVNTTPIHPHRSFFTLNNIGTACCPYRVTGRDDFVAQVAEQGYRLRGSWLNLTKGMALPFEPGLSLEHYSGFCFDRHDRVDR